MTQTSFQGFGFSNLYRTEILLMSHFILLTIFHLFLHIYPTTGINPSRRKSGPRLQEIPMNVLDVILKLGTVPPGLMYIEGAFELKGGLWCVPPVSEQDGKASRGLQHRLLVSPDCGKLVLC